MTNYLTKLFGRNKPVSDLTAEQPSENEKLQSLLNDSYRYAAVLKNAGLSQKTYEGLVSMLDNLRQNPDKLPVVKGTLENIERAAITYEDRNEISHGSLAVIIQNQKGINKEIEGLKYLKDQDQKDVKVLEDQVALAVEQYPSIKVEKSNVVQLPGRTPVAQVAKKGGYWENYMKPSLQWGGYALALASLLFLKSCKPEEKIIYKTIEQPAQFMLNVASKPVKDATGKAIQYDKPMTVLGTPAGFYDKKKQMVILVERKGNDYTLTVKFVKPEDKSKPKKEGRKLPRGLSQPQAPPKM